MGPGKEAHEGGPSLSPRRHHLEIASPEGVAGPLEDPQVIGAQGLALKLGQPPFGLSPLPPGRAHLRPFYPFSGFPGYVKMGLMLGGQIQP